MSITAHTLVGLKDAITSLTPVVLGTFEPSVRVMLSEGVAVTEGASSRSIGVEAMLVCRRVPGWLNWAGVQWDGGVGSGSSGSFLKVNKFCRAVRAHGLGAPLHSTMPAGMISEQDLVSGRIL